MVAFIFVGFVIVATDGFEELAIHSPTPTL
jgi:hypothetical protein